MDGGLQVDGRLGWIDSHGQVVQHHLTGVLPERLNVFLLRTRSQHMEIANEEVTLELILKANTIVQRPHIVPQMHPSGGAVAGQDTLPFRHRFSP